MICICCVILFIRLFYAINWNIEFEISGNLSFFKNVVSYNTNNKSKSLRIKKAFKLSHMLSWTFP